MKCFWVRWPLHPNAKLSDWKLCFLIGQFVGQSQLASSCLVSLMGSQSNLEVRARVIWRLKSNRTRWLPQACLEPHCGGWKKERLVRHLCLPMLPLWWLLWATSSMDISGRQAWTDIPRAPKRKLQDFFWPSLWSPVCHILESKRVLFGDLVAIWVLLFFCGSIFLFVSNNSPDSL